LKEYKHETFRRVLMRAMATSGFVAAGFVRHLFASRTSGGIPWRLAAERMEGHENA
jgi:hypothetical protein